MDFSKLKKVIVDEDENQRIFNVDVADMEEKQVEEFIKSYIDNIKENENANV